MSASIFINSVNKQLLVIFSDVLNSQGITGQIIHPTHFFSDRQCHEDEIKKKQIIWLPTQKLDSQTFISEFESQWVPHPCGVVPHLSKILSKLRLK